MSRSLDDGIAQHLNSILIQPKSEFDPSDSSLMRVSRCGSEQLSSNACQKFTQQFVFPSWNSRDNILQYCKYVATNMEKNESKTFLGKDDRPEDIDHPLDPYSTRSLRTQTEAQMLSDFLKLENGVENIVRNRTWKVIYERCGLNSKSWEDSFSEWKRHLGECSDVEKWSAIP